MILHIIAYEKFTEDYIKRINKLFNVNDHRFLVFGEKNCSEIREVTANNVVYSINFSSKLGCALYLIKNILKAKKVIIHALFLSDMYMKVLILLQPLCTGKYFWNIWGYDLYNVYWNRNDNLKREQLRKKFISRLKAVGYIKGDYEFLKKHYDTNAKFYLASYSYDFYTPEMEITGKDKNQINILLGNSATRECQYEEIIDRLKEYSDLPIMVKCVLSYPTKNVEYREHIINYGKMTLGEKFEPLVDFMTYEEYTKLLSGIDIAVFNHNRQQALGNIASLLYLGKRVYINPMNACKEYFEDIGAQVYSVEDLDKEDICKKDTQELKQINRKAIDDFFSDEQFKERWRKIFEEKY